MAPPMPSPNKRNRSIPNEQNETIPTPSFKSSNKRTTSNTIQSNTHIKSAYTTSAYPNISPTVSMHLNAFHTPTPHFTPKHVNSRRRIQKRTVPPVSAKPIQSNTQIQSTRDDTQKIVATNEWSDDNNGTEDCEWST
jgi:hypothetical protein